MHKRFSSKVLFLSAVKSLYAGIRRKRHTPSPGEKNMLALKTTSYLSVSAQTSCDGSRNILKTSTGILEFILTTSTGCWNVLGTWARWCRCKRACVDVGWGTRFNAAVYVHNVSPFNVKIIDLFSINEQGMTHDTILWPGEVENTNVMNAAP